jgi:hypothetical protein
MKLIPYDINKIRGSKWYSKSENLRILEEFNDSGLECVKVENYTCKDAYNCASSLKNSIKIYRMPWIKAMARNGEVFLIKVKD